MPDCGHRNFFAAYVLSLLLCITSVNGFRHSVSYSGGFGRQLAQAKGPVSFIEHLGDETPAAHLVEI
jgi:hypothetical protein